MSTNNATINTERLRSDLEDLASIGRSEEDRGIYRMAFTEADMAGRKWLVEQLEAAGMSGEIDGAGNVVGQMSNGSSGPSILVG